MGMMASMFISNPIHAISQWELIITIIVPIMTVVKIIERIKGLISTGRI